MKTQQVFKDIAKMRAHRAKWLRYMDSCRINFHTEYLTSLNVETIRIKWSVWGVEYHADWTIEKIYKKNLAESK